MISTSPRSVSAAEITRNFGMWQDRAAQGPLIVTHHGRPRVALVSIEDYETLSGGEALPGAGAGHAEAELAILLDHIHPAFVAFDDQLRFRRINAAARAYWAQPDQALIGLSLAEAFPAIEDELIVAQLTRALRTREHVQFDAPSQRYPERMLRFRMFAYPDGVAAIFSDVANEVEELQAAAVAAAMIAARAVHRQVGIGRLSVRGTFAAIEQPLADLVGFDIARLMGVRLSEILAVNQRVAANEEVEAVLTGSGPRTFDSAMLVNGGGELPVRIALAEIREGFAISGAALLLTPVG